MKRAAPWSAVILLIGCVALGVLVLRQRSEMARAVSERDAEKKVAQSRIVDLQSQVAILREAQVKTAKQIAQLVQGASAPQDPQGKGANGAAREVHIGDIIKEHPEYAAIFEKQIRRNVDRMYGSGLNTLNLPPDQLAQLKNLLVERQISSSDAEQAAASAGLERGSPAWQAAIQQATQDVQSQISSILGSNATSILAQLQARSGIQSQVEYAYAPDFEDAGMPLSPDQTNGLIQAMADANYAGKDISTRPADYNVADPTTWLTPHDNRIINGAAQVLTAAQLQVLTTDQMQNQQMIAIYKQYRTGGTPVNFVP